MSTTHIEDLYPLSPMQQGMLFQTLYSPASGVYVSQLICILQGKLDHQAFAQAWQSLVERHTILRTAFLWENLVEPLQVVYRHVNVQLEEQDWSELSEKEQQTRLEHFLREERIQGFDLSQAPLMRLTIIQLNQDLYQFIWTHHHILLDGWCFSLILKEVFATYETLRQDRPVSSVNSVPYRNYISWLQQQDRTRAEVFWRANLKGFTYATPLPMDQLSGHPFKIQTSYAEERLRLSVADTTALQHLARQHHLTLNTVIQGAWALLLSRYSGEEDIVFGTSVSGRPAELEGIESMLGLCLNTLPVRVRVSLRSELLPWLRMLQANLLKARQYEYAPLFEIQQWSDISKGRPLFESLLIFENYPVDITLTELANNLVVKDLIAFEQTNYPLTLTVAPGAELRMRMMYDCHRFEAATIKRILSHYEQLLVSITTHFQQALGTLPYMDANEQQLQLVYWNLTRQPYPSTRCIHELIEAQVQRTPDATALVFDEQHLSYNELNRCANRVAYLLQTLGVGPDICVGLLVERSLEMMIGLLGVLKAGGAYIPLDPTYPPQRLAFMLENSSARVLLTQRSLSESLPPHNAHVVYLPHHGLEQMDQEHYAGHPGNLMTSLQLAYVIYTSGSTGQPKGTAISHQAVVNFFNSMLKRPGLSSEDIVLAVTSISFDIAALELLLPLTAGACVRIVSQESACDGQHLAAQLTSSGATIMQATPATWSMLLEAGWTGSAHLKILCGGESLSPELASHLRSRGKSVWNMYGPTETTIWSSLYEVQGTEHRIPIGQAIDNTQLYVLDSDLQPVPIGTTGELYIGGDGLARGYLHLPKLTAEKFLPNPFSDKAGSLMYRTGDLARWQVNGNLEWLGRLGYQVKLRGFRIELEEIEILLRQYPLVQEAIVAIREMTPSDKQLVAYLKVEDASVLNLNELRRFLKQKLPAYMIPASFIPLKSFPLTPNRKVNRHALMTLDQNEGELDTDTVLSVAPRTPLEELLVQIWASFLGSQQIGIYDNFFELGGHSLLVLQLTSQIYETFHVDVPLRLVFEKPFIADLAASIAQKLAEQIDDDILVEIDKMPE